MSEKRNKDLEKFAIIENCFNKIKNGTATKKEIDAAYIIVNDINPLDSLKQKQDKVVNFYRRVITTSVIEILKVTAAKDEPTQTLLKEIIEKFKTYGPKSDVDDIQKKYK